MTISLSTDGDPSDEKLYQMLQDLNLLPDSSTLKRAITRGLITYPNIFSDNIEVEER